MNPQGDRLYFANPQTYPVISAYLGLDASLISAISLAFLRYATA